VIDAAGVTRLLGIRAPDQRIVSVYLTVPLDPAQRRGVPAHLDEMLAQGHGVSDDGEAWARVRRSELPVIRREVSTHAHEWLGHSVAIFACAKLRLLETIPLRGQVRDRAVIGTRPYVRPLLAELQRSPCYAVAVVDRRHAWLFRVSGETISPVDHVQSQTVGSKRFGGWHGFQSYRNDQRARKLAREHYAAAGAAVAGTVGEGGCGPIVVGGHERETSDFAAGLPPSLRDRVAGTFVIDPHAMTPARVRQLADEVVADWEDRRERRLAAALAEQATGNMTAIGVDACLAAANQHAIQLLVVPDDEVRPGFRCEHCGALAVAGGLCSGCGGPTRPVDDVIEELAVRVTEEGGSVHSVRGTEVLTDVAARRRFPAVA
jgi:peptide subunit release factor 1 (eRF1)